MANSLKKLEGETLNQTSKEKNKKKYYKGNIILNRKFDKYSSSLLIAKIFDNKIFFKLPWAKFREELNLMKPKIEKMIMSNKSFCKIKYEEVSNIIQERENKFHDGFSELNYLTGYEIIYELVKTKNGNLFGKELYTGLLFPILTKEMISYNYGLGIDFLDYAYLVSIPIIGKNIGSLIVRSYDVSKKEIREYTRQFRGIFRLKRHKDKIKEFASQNNLDLIDVENTKVIETKEEITKPKLNNDIKLISEIEYNLSILKDIDENLYNKFKNEFDKYINKNITSICVLGNLLAKIQAEIMIKKAKPVDLINYLNNLKYEYINNFINESDKKTDIDLKKIDKISELFIKKREEYNALDIIKVINNLGIIYFFEVYENRDILSINELENSYFSVYLENIVTIIKKLEDLRLIKCSYFISLVESLNVKVVFDMIKSIDFIKIEKENLVKVLKTL